MKSTLTKISAIIAMLISLVSFGLVITALFVSAPADHVGESANRPFALWVFSMVVAMFSLIFYFIDAILSAVKVFMKIHPIFNAILSAMLIGAIPMAIFVGSSPSIGIYIWNAYYLAIFILEIVSVVKHVKVNFPKSKVI